MISVLVDTDNVDIELGAADLESVTTHILSRIRSAMSSENVVDRQRVTMRFYGGWYEDNLLTRRGQDLSAAIQELFPMPYQFDAGPKMMTWMINGELAVSLTIQPNVHLIHTFRRRQTLAGVRVADPLTVGCDLERCTVKGIKQLVKKGACPDCGTPANKILWRAEQKLVDVMLATDFLALASQEDSHVCLVSSDDDFWPVLFHTALTVDTPVYHIHAKPGRQLAEHYVRYAPENYREILYEEEE